MQIKIKNFQVLRDIEIEVEGLTFIVGDTNEGKSAIVRAVEAAMFNKSGTDFINFDSASCQVDIIMPSDGVYGDVSLSWVKSKKSGSSYVINGVDYEKLGRSFPQVLVENGIKEIEVGKTKYRLMFWRQMDYPFLIKDNPSVIFDFLSRMLEERKLIPVIKEIGDDVKDKREDYTKLSAVVENDIVRIKTLLNDKNLYEDVLTNCPSADTIIKDQSSLVEMIKIQTKLIDIDSRLKDIDSRVGILGTLLNSIKYMDNIKEENIFCREMKEFYGKIYSIEADINSKQLNIDKYREINDIGLDSNTIQEYQNLIKFNGVMSSIVSRERELDSRISVLSSIKGDFNFDVDSYTSLFSLQKKLNDLDIVMSRLVMREMDAKKRLEVCDNNIVEFKDKVKMCPLCERAF